MLLYDRVMEAAGLSLRRRGRNHVEWGLAGLLDNAVVYDINSVVPLFSDWESEKAKKVPRRPPHPVTWVEWDSNDDDVEVRVGALITGFEETGAKQTLDGILAKLSETDAGLTAVRKFREYPIHYGVNLFYYVRKDDEESTQAVLHLTRNKPFLAIDEALGMIGMSEDGAEVSAFAGCAIREAEDTDLFDTVIRRSKECFNEGDGMDFPWPALMAFALLHCKNIKAEDNFPNAAMNRRLAKHGNRPHVTYKTLKIEAPADRRKHNHSDAGEDDDGPKVRFHVCSGHLKHLQSERYREKRGQWVWCPAHWKGSKELGEVHKRYQVDAKK